jgi:chemotaxis response regulator CheB
MRKVLIADDSEVMRVALREALEEETSIEVVGEASSFAETMQMISDFKPDVFAARSALAAKTGLHARVGKIRSQYRPNARRVF